MTDQFLEEDFISEDDEIEAFDTIVEALDEQSVNVQDIISLTARLAQILAEEADYLEQMQVSKLSDLQKEKLALTEALETTKKYVAKHPEVLEHLSAEERDDLSQVVYVFNAILDENYRRLSMARAVNHRIVQAITEVIQESTRNDVYDRKGTAGKPIVDSVSVTLDQQV